MDFSQDVDHDYDGNSDGGPREEFLEYTDLAVAEKGNLNAQLFSSFRNC